MTPMLAAGTALEPVQQALTSLSGDITTIIPAALGVSVLIFGSKKLWKVAKSFVS